MRIFFNDIDTLHRFTLELDRHQESHSCKTCTKNNQFVSHGFVHKKQLHGKTLIVGKRIICSNRFGRTGCGRTFRLYLSQQIPRLRYTTDHLFIFLSALIAGLTIKKAYTKATHKTDARNAFRWLNKLQRQLVTYRAEKKRPVTKMYDVSNTGSDRLKILLPTVKQLFSLYQHSPCQHYQLSRQQRFM